MQPDLARVETFASAPCAKAGVVDGEDDGFKKRNVVVIEGTVDEYISLVLGMTHRRRATSYVRSRRRSLDRSLRAVLTSARWETGRRGGGPCLWTATSCPCLYVGLIASSR